jgi:hypothetical protein
VLFSFLFEIEFLATVTAFKLLASLFHFDYLPAMRLTSPRYGLLNRRITPCLGLVGGQSADRAHAVASGLRHLYEYDHPLFETQTIMLRL